MEPGYCTEVKFIRAIDGDTIEVEMVRRFKVRVLGIDVEEKNTDVGRKAKLFVNNLLKQAKRILIQIPTNDPIKLTDINSFERLLANIEVDGEDLVSILRDNGYGLSNKINKSTE